MQFACIRDCSVCPLACYRHSQVGQTVQNVQSSSPLPDVLQKTMEVEDQEKSEDLTVPDSIIPDDEYTEEANNAIQEAQNLPVLAEVQYELKDVNPKKGILNLFKKR